MNLRLLAAHAVSEAPILRCAAGPDGVRSVSADGTLARSSLAKSERTGRVEGRHAKAAIGSGCVALASDAVVMLASLDGTLLATAPLLGTGLIATAFVDAGRTLVVAEHKELLFWQVDALVAGRTEAENPGLSPAYAISDHATLDTLVVGSIGSVDRAIGGESLCPFLGNFAVLAVSDAGEGAILFGGERAYDGNAVAMVRQMLEEDAGTLFRIAGGRVERGVTTSEAPLAIATGASKAAVAMLDGAVHVIDPVSLDRLAEAALPAPPTSPDWSKAWRDVLELPSSGRLGPRAPTGGMTFDSSGTLWVGTAGGIVAAYAVE